MKSYTHADCHIKRTIADCSHAPQDHERAREAIVRGFSDDERAAIREALVETGRELLDQYGPKKTTVADLTDEVGIAKGTFYQFFDSKGALYLTIFAQECEEFVEQVRRDLTDESDAEAGLQRLLSLYVEWVETSPLMQRLVVRDDPDRLVSDIPTERLKDHRDAAFAELTPVVERWQREDSMRDVDLAVFYGTMGVVGLVALHREGFEEYREGLYEAVRDLLINALVRGLITE